MQTQVDLGWTQNGATPISGRKTITHNGANEMDFAVPASSTNLAFLFASDATNRVGYCFVSDQAVTVKVNSSSDPDLTLSLAANVPEISAVPAASSPLTDDITELFFTNAGSVDATVKVRTLQDPVSGS